MAGKYVATMSANASVTTAFPFFQLNIAAGVPIRIFGVEILNETSLTSQILIAVAARRTTVTTGLSATTVPAKLSVGYPTPATTYAAGIGNTTTGTASDANPGPRWPFNALSGLFWVPTPDQQIIHGAAAATWWTLNMATAPSPALTLGANVYFEELV